MTALLLAAALAHPFHDRAFGHELGVTVDRDAVLIEYRADIPTRALWSEARGQPDGFAERKAGELLAGLTVTIDGATALLTTLPSPPSAVDETFARITVAVTAALDPALPHVIEIGNANAPDEVAYHRAMVRVMRDWRVPSCSLVGSGRSLDGQWRLDEAARRLTVQVAPRSGPSSWVLAVHPDPHGYRSVTDAVGRATFDELGETWAPLIGLGVALAGVVVGLRARDAHRARQRRGTSGV